MAYKNNRRTQDLLKLAGGHQAVCDSLGLKSRSGIYEWEAIPNKYESKIKAMIVKRKKSFTKLFHKYYG